MVLRDGFAQLGVSEIAARLACSKRTLYELASSKRELVLTVLDRFFQRVRADGARASASAADTEQRIYAYLEVGARAAERLSQTTVSDIHGWPPARKLWQEHVRLRIDGLTRIIESGIREGVFRNVSSAFDIARLISYAAADERIGSIMRMAEYDFLPGKRNVHVNSTNRLVRQGELDVLGGKTGFISSSGYCLATLVRLPQSGRQVAMVVLGARSNAARFAETRHLFNWLNASTAATATESLQQQ